MSVSLAIPDQWPITRYDVMLAAAWIGIATGTPTGVAGGLVVLLGGALAPLGAPAGVLVLDPGEPRGERLVEFPDLRLVGLQAVLGFGQFGLLAREIGQEVIAEECLAIIDSDPECVVSEGSTHRDSAHISWLKNRAEMRLKLLAKWNPKKWGDKVDVTSDGKQVGLAIAIDLSEKKTEAA